MMCLDDWAFIPGPAADPPQSSLHLYDLTDYPPEVVAEAVLSFPNMLLQNPANGDWWQWEAKWRQDNRYIRVGMSLFETIPVSWGGSPLHGYCEMSDIITLWEMIRVGCPGIWMHNSNCEIHTPESFIRLFLSGPGGGTDSVDTA